MTTTGYYAGHGRSMSIPIAQRTNCPTRASVGDNSRQNRTDQIWMRSVNTTVDNGDGDPCTATQLLCMTNI
jgi:hypothetical protein